jgi:prolyl 4-hydroxylase
MHLPDITPPEGEWTVQGQRLSVLSRITRPRAVLLDGVLSADECGELIDYAHSKGLKSSGVVDRETGESIHHQARTSTSVCFTRAETLLIDTIERRLAALTGWPVTHGEGLQVLRYEPGQQYRSHFDWFNPEKAGSALHLKRGGQRVGTTVIYLSPAHEGGGTRFPKAGVEVSPRAGGAIFFTNLDPCGRPDHMSLHAGTPVVKGTKIVMTYWQRESAFL